MPTPADNKITMIKESMKRCDYRVLLDGWEYYVWAFAEGGVQMHYYGTPMEPDNKTQDTVLKFLRERKKGNTYFEKCFK